MTCNHEPSKRTTTEGGAVIRQTCECGVSVEVTHPKMHVRSYNCKAMLDAAFQQLRAMEPIEVRP